ncbi:Os11g0257800 [Oryza sativa Japonica Group]|uniref:Os11g0257800 protein n=2 Tax=Oryza sativa subsp. japonica TaxID=39947 RepID=C7J9B4_ORYSJ|nr:hypothetical protein EE612_054550 [Oryza sativa]BAH95193.1 Os11g0257800 [Oryza sativa Japonica Group]BAT13479.1 Os11g0257800 [Oryza sativa Japonica Group]|eukprot:NP_001176465.1 Os11g0257800 [Oryza sativa Japonica Group]
MPSSVVNHVAPSCSVAVACTQRRCCRRGTRAALSPSTSEAQATDAIFSFAGALLLHLLCHGWSQRNEKENTREEKKENF